MRVLRSTIASSRRRLAAEEGAVLVIVAICLVVILGAAALAIDLGSFYGAQKTAQTAADAAALAAAHDVAESPDYAQATTDVQTYVARNDPQASTPTISYPSAHQIKVTVNATVPTFFGQIFGKTSENISASATAGANDQAPAAAVFAEDTSCGTGITFTGSNAVTIDGSVHSNGSLTFSGSSSQTIDGTASYGGPNGCNETTTSSSQILGGSWRDPQADPWPVDYTPVGNLCTESPTPANVHVSATAMSFGGGGTSTISGIYCAPSISFSGSGTYSGNATFIATSGTFTVGGNVTYDVSPDTTDLAADLPAGSNLTNLSAYQMGTGDMQIQGNSLHSGSFFAPAPGAVAVVDGNAVSSLGGSGNSGFVEAWDVQFAGTSALTITGTGPAIPGDSGATLTQ